MSALHLIGRCAFAAPLLLLAITAPAIAQRGGAERDPGRAQQPAPRPDHHHPDQGRADQGRADQRRARQGRVEARRDDRSDAGDHGDAPTPQGVGAGHLVLVVEGTARALAVTTAVAKSSEWGGVAKAATSEFAFVALGADGVERWRVPIDLSRFDTDPARVDAPVVVEGCRVRTPRISMLLNVPTDAAAARFELRRGAAVLGRLSAAQLQQLLRGGR